MSAEVTMCPEKENTIIAAAAPAPEARVDWLNPPGGSPRCRRARWARGVLSILRPLRQIAAHVPKRNWGPSNNVKRAGEGEQSPAGEMKMLQCKG